MGLLPLLLLLLRRGLLVDAKQVSSPTAICPVLT
jgi:hypothetical protein